MIVKSLVVMLILLASLSASFAKDAVPGSQVVAKSSNRAVIIWDASPLVATLLEQKLPDEQISVRLELLAVSIIVTRAKSLPNATTITTKVIYMRTGDVSPVYKTTTLTGMEQLLSVTASRADAVVNRDSWRNGIAAGKLPREVTVLVTGEYPH